jgi:hypothetical protein
LLSGPLMWLTEPKGLMAIVVFSALNSIIWGMCLGLPIYAIKQRLQRQPRSLTRARVTKR